MRIKFEENNKVSDTQKSPQLLFKTAQTELTKRIIVTTFY